MTVSASTAQKIEDLVARPFELGREDSVEPVLDRQGDRRRGVGVRRGEGTVGVDAFLDVVGLERVGDHRP